MKEKSKPVFFAKFGSNGKLTGLALLLLGFEFLLLGLGLRRNSLTWDENTHIAVGYSIVARGQDAYWLLYEHGHPPRVNALEAVILYWVNPHIPVEILAGWKTSVSVFCQAFTAHSFSVEQFQVLARLPSTFLTVLLGSLVYRWGKDLWGAKAGLLGLALWALDPTVLAHGQLATTDMGVITFGTAALYCVWRWIRLPSWRLTLAAGSLLGLTLLSKYSGVFWMAATIAMIGAAGLCQVYPKRFSARVLCQSLVLLSLSLIIVWTAFGFSWGHMPGLPVLVPAADYWRGLAHQSESAVNRWTFAFGFRQYGGWWWYFPAAFLIKNPIPFLVLLGFGGAVLLISAPRRLLWLSLFPVIYSASAIYSRFNIGYRHILPIHPFLYLILGGGIWCWIRWMPQFSWKKALLVSGLLAWQFVSVIQVWPNDLAYFNELIGGPQNGYKYLVDSNLDWGQTPPEIRAAILKAYPNIQVVPAARPHAPDAGWYLIDASALQGLGDRFTYEWFRHVQPKTVVDATQLIYEVPPFDPAWLAQCDVPTPPLNDQALAKEFGGPNWRGLHFDCSQAWIYPGGAAQSGIYALNYGLYHQPAFDLSTFTAALPTPIDDFVARHVSRARFSFDRPGIGDKDAYSSTGFVLYEMSGGIPLPPLTSRLYAGSSDLVPAAAGTNNLVSASPRVGEALKFLGIKTYSQADSLDVETWWQYTQDTPLSRPFSIMAHLIQADGTTLEVADGLGVSPLMLGRGDIVVQRHRFSRPANGQPLWLQTGIYWLDNMERWRINGSPNVDLVLVSISG